MKLLIVDDQRSVYLYIVKVLNLPELGYDKVFYAQNGIEAYEFILEESPDVMILDIQMPELNGIELLKKLKADAVQKPETIILSAYDEFSYAQQCIEYGINFYILKPINPNELCEILIKIHLAIENHYFEHLKWLFLIYCKQCRKNEKPTEIVQKDKMISSFAYRVLCVSDNDCILDFFSDEVIANSTEYGMRFALLKNSTNLQLDEGSMVWGISNVHYSETELWAAIVEAEDNLWAHFYDHISYTGLHSDSTMEEPAQLICLIYKHFDSSPYECLQEIVIRTFEIFYCRKTPPDSVISLCRNCLDILSKQLYGASIEDSNWPGKFIYAEELYELFWKIILNFKKGVPMSILDSDEKIVRQIKEYVDTHYDRDLSLASISETFYISRFQISRLFKRLYNVNYKDYVLSVRMNAANNLLKHTDMRLYDIALSVGFNDSSYFSNVFKKKYNMNPQTYRKRREDTKNE